MASPNLKIEKLVIGAESVDTIVEKVNKLIDVLDLHNHGPTRGLKVQVQGMNVDDNLNFNDNGIQQMKFMGLKENPAIPADLPKNSIYEINGVLAWRDRNGTDRSITNLQISDVIQNSWYGVVPSTTLLTGDAVRTLIYNDYLVAGNRTFKQIVNIGEGNAITFPATAQSGTYYFIWYFVPKSILTNFWVLNENGDRDKAWLDYGSDIDVSGIDYRLFYRRIPILNETRYIFINWR